MRDVEIFSIGDELLRGIVADTNSGWIAKRVAARGGRLRRVTTLPDDPDEVADELAAAIRRRPALIVTQGGLGPTDDDRTREAIALATGRPQQRHPDAEAIVRRRYAELAENGVVAERDLGDARVRMADLPLGATPLDNEIGSAPAIVLHHDDVTLVALPGVPPELQWIWDNPLASVLDEVLGPGGFDERTFRTDSVDESSMTHLLRFVQQRHPGVYVKSRASGFGPGDEVRITLAASGASRDDARALVDAAASDLRAALLSEGVTLAPEDA